MPTICNICIIHIHDFTKNCFDLLPHKPLQGTNQILDCMCTSDHEHLSDWEEVRLKTTSLQNKLYVISRQLRHINSAVTLLQSSATFKVTHQLLLVRSAAIKSLTVWKFSYKQVILYRVTNKLLCMQSSAPS